MTSIGIKEGVVKNLEITYGRFQGLDYASNASANFQVYDSSKVSGRREIYGKGFMPIEIKFVGV
jgi:hypothetical protein